MISDSTTIVKFETLASTAAIKLNELLIIIQDMKLAPETPPVGFDCDFIKLIESKYPGEEPGFRAAKQYYYFFGLLQRFCHTLFYQTKETPVAQMSISIHLVTYLLAFDTQPVAYQSFFLDTELGQNILHFCLIAFNHSKLWQNFLPLLKESPYYNGLNYCAFLITQTCYDENNPLFNLDGEIPLNTTCRFTYSTKALIDYVIKTKAAILPSTLTVTPNNISESVECY
jgi:hypothetical protein